MHRPQQLYDGAVYLHQGEGYLVTDLDLAQRTATLRRQDTTYYTQVGLIVFFLFGGGGGGNDDGGQLLSCSFVSMYRPTDD